MVDEKKNNSVKNVVVTSMVFFSLNFYVNFLEPKSSPSKMTCAPSQPLRMTPGNKPSWMTRDQGVEAAKRFGDVAQPVSVEAFSGLRLRSVSDSPSLITCPDRCLVLLPED